MTIADRDPRVLAVLLAALHDRLNEIRAPRWQREGEAGFARAGWIKCPKCQGGGEGVWKGRTVPCDRCKGRAGWYGDPMMADKISREITLTPVDNGIRHFVRTVIDMELPELDRLDHAIDVTLGLADDLEREARSQARTDHPSTILLWEGLSRMLRDWPHHATLLYRVYVHAWQPLRSLSEGDREDVDQALVILGTLCLPASFRAPQWALRAVECEHRTAKDALWRGHSIWAKANRAKRRELIAQWTAEGHPNEEIARRTGLSVRRVQQLRNGQKEAA